MDCTTYCPPSSIIGTATIQSPLVPDEIIGRVYAINAAVPHIGIWIDPSVAPTTRRVSPSVCSPALTPAQSADEGDGGIQTIQLNLNSIPDIPVTRLEMIIGDNP